MFYISKIFHCKQEKYGVVVEGQGRDWECDGSSPGHDIFEKVFFLFGLILSNLIEIKTSTV